MLSSLVAKAYRRSRVFFPPFLPNCSAGFASSFVPENIYKHAALISTGTAS